MNNKIIEDILIKLEDTKRLIIGFQMEKKVSYLELDLTLSKLRDMYEQLLKLNLSESNAEIKPEPVTEINIKTETETKTIEETPDSILIKQDRVSIPVHSDTYHSASQPVGKKEVFLQSTVMTNIEKSIGISERYLFLRELFSNNVELYSSTLKELNKAENYNDSINYLKSNFKWDMESEPVKVLVDILKRKHNE